MTEQPWDARDAGRDLLADVTRAITGARTAAAGRGYVLPDADLARAVLASPALQDANRKMLDGMLGEYELRIAADIGANAGRVIADAAPGIRAAVAEEIATAIEKSVCAPGDQCSERFCPDCTRWRQCQADAATARRIGGAS